MYVGIGMLNLALAIPLGMEYGGIGCAVAAGFSMLLGDGFVMNWFYAKEIHLSIGKFWREIVKISLLVLPCLAVGILLNKMFPPMVLWGFCSKVVVYTIVYGAVMFAFGMTEEEKGRILRR